MRFEQETSVYKDKTIQERIDAAGGAATRYITEIGNGIRVHPENDTQNYLDIKDGLEIFREGESVAKYGETTRIGRIGAARFDIGTGAITGYSGYHENLKIGEAVDDETGAYIMEESGIVQPFTYDGTTYYGLYTGEHVYQFVSCKVNGVDATGVAPDWGDEFVIYSPDATQGDHISVTYLTYDGRPCFKVGLESEATAPDSAAFGEGKAKRYASFAEGSGTAEGAYAHAEGELSTASGRASHAEGSGNASGDSSHAEGIATKASGYASHAGGLGTSAVGDYQCVLGRYNVEDANKAVIIGGGSSDTNRKNVLTIDWDGNVLCGLVNGIFLGLESITDWNTAYDSTKPLRFLKAWNASNAPESSANIVGIEFNINATNRTQFVFRTNSGAGRNGVFVRHCVGNTWDSWMTVSVS